MSDISGSTLRRKLRTNNVADKYKISRRMVRYLVESGELPVERDGPRIFKYDAIVVDEVGRRLGYIKGEA
jgi:orotate phosphoribosyltransferase-like protein